MKHIKYITIGLLIWTGYAFCQAGPLYVKVKRENIRKSPNGDKIAEAVAGTQVEVLERQNNWVKVQLTGWIWENSLTADQTTVEGYEIEANHILVSNREEALNILDQLHNGSDFSQLAQKHSIDRASGIKGGLLGQFGRGDFLPAFDNAAFKLKVGEISDVVKTELGYHIIMRSK